MKDNRIFFNAFNAVGFTIVVFSTYLTSIAPVLDESLASDSVKLGKDSAGLASLYSQAGRTTITILDGEFALPTLEIFDASSSLPRWTWATYRLAPVQWLALGFLTFCFIYDLTGEFGQESQDGILGKYCEGNPIRSNQFAKFDFAWEICS